MAFQQRSNLRGLGEAAVSPAAAAAPQFYEEPGALVLNVTLTANQEARGQGVFVDGDADFRIESITGSSTGAYQLKFKTPREKYFPDDYARASNLVGSAAFPFPMPAPIIYPAGSKINVDLKDLSGAANTVQIVLLGFRIFRLRG